MTTITRDELLALDAALVDAEQNVRLAREVIQRLMLALEEKNGHTFRDRGIPAAYFSPEIATTKPTTINVSAIPAEGHL